ncbi:MAG: aminomethyl-transferring glycine dehydrogenase subunit GcvPA [Thermoclostridium sp.]|nr:aminomethyl-transferring glycine dehydrogenase subunit GcvPA [Thermoclostridium sp.]
MSDYIPNTHAQQMEMLKDIGLASMEDLFAAIPQNVRLKRELNLPAALSEMELTGQMSRMSAKNSNTDEYACFLGAGAYDHYIPAVVASLLARQEFYTAYTPYQPEISQGTLQAIFEYQTMICRLTGMDVANASMYDGSSALAEAASAACHTTGRKEILAALSVHPESREVLSTYSRFSGNKVTEVGFQRGRLDLAELEAKLSEKTAAVVVQSPNFFGAIEDLKEIAFIAHKAKALLIVSCDPISLAILKSPGELGADIAVGEGQSMGNPLSFGGPYLGFFAAKKELLRRMPGRIVGETFDKEGRRAFVLTVQTREQHIRREKATSNICSNQALNALAATIYLTAMGKQGLRKVALLCVSKAHYAYEQLLKTGLFQPCFDAPFFKEFAVYYNGNVTELNQKLLQYGIIGGYDLEKQYSTMKNGYLVAVTEKRTREEIDLFCAKAVELC